LRTRAPEELKNKRKIDAEEIERKVGEVKDIHKSVSCHIANRILTGEGASLSTTSKSRKKYSLKTIFNHSANKELISTDLIIERCYTMLTQINCHSRKHLIPLDNNQTSIKLQRLIFKLVNYMFEHQIITLRQLKHFIAMPRTLKLAARNMIASFEQKFSRDSFHPKYTRPQFILNHPYSSHFWLMFQGKFFFFFQ
jgi:hypothetical protein